jgi:hypothetical protein
MPILAEGVLEGLAKRLLRHEGGPLRLMASNVKATLIRTVFQPPPRYPPTRFGGAAKLSRRHSANSGRTVTILLL